MNAQRRLCPKNPILGHMILTHQQKDVNIFILYNILVAQLLMLYKNNFNKIHYCSCSFYDLVAQDDGRYIFMTSLVLLLSTTLQKHKNNNVD